MLTWAGAGDLPGPLPGFPAWLAVARGLAALGLRAATASRFLRLLDQFRQVGDDLPLQVLRLLAGIAPVETLLDIAHRLGNLQERVLRLAFLLGRRAKFLLQLLLHRFVHPPGLLSSGLGRIAQQCAIVVVARLGIQAVAELIVGRGRRAARPERPSRQEEESN